ncbi:MAG TPA: SDR family oxidoreductase [Candidatus Lustribacter sp.]|jgi:NAD(P)-dependent dehydrogenase (short-subunit alcohol dehydrogenase family)|nr:SDR family oxidoreductase [Candidatus Lustribacter sp.]
MNGVLLVTGGGRGIGAAVAVLAAQRGFDVAVNYLEDERAASAVVEAVRSNGVRALALKGDVSVEADVVRMFEAVDTFGPLKALVNNAGITGGFSRVADLKAATLERVLAVNVTGAMLCAREAVRRLSTVWGGDGGSIVNLSSLASKLGGGGEWVHYAASKGAINTFTVGLAREVAGEGVRVNAVAAGIVDTEMHLAAGDPHRAKRTGATVPIGRAATPHEIAEAIVWLTSPAASYVTGTILEAGGGR